MQPDLPADGVEHVDGVALAERDVLGHHLGQRQAVRRRRGLDACRHVGHGAGQRREGAHRPARALHRPLEAIEVHLIDDQPARAVGVDEARKAGRGLSAGQVGAVGPRAVLLAVEDHAADVRLGVDRAVGRQRLAQQRLAGRQVEAVDDDEPAAAGLGAAQDPGELGADELHAPQVEAVQGALVQRHQGRGRRRREHPAVAVGEGAGAARDHRAAGRVEAEAIERRRPRVAQRVDGHRARRQRRGRPRVDQGDAAGGDVGADVTQPVTARARLGGQEGAAGAAVVVERRLDHQARAVGAARDPGHHAQGQGDGDVGDDLVERIGAGRQHPRDDLAGAAGAVLDAARHPQRPGRVAGQPEAGQPGGQRVAALAVVVEVDEPQGEPVDARDGVGVHDEAHRGAVRGPHEGHGQRVRRLAGAQHQALAVSARRLRPHQGEPVGHLEDLPRARPVRGPARGRAGEGPAGAAVGGGVGERVGHGDLAGVAEIVARARRRAGDGDAVAVGPLILRPGLPVIGRVDQQGPARLAPVGAQEPPDGGADPRHHRVPAPGRPAQGRADPGARDHDVVPGPAAVGAALQQRRVAEVGLAQGEQRLGGGVLGDERDDRRGLDAAERRRHRGVARSIDDRRGRRVAGADVGVGDSVAGDERVARRRRGRAVAAPQEGAHEGRRGDDSCPHGGTPCLGREGT